MQLSETPRFHYGGFIFNDHLPFSLDSCFLGKYITPRPVFDISYTHLKFNKSAIDLIMHPGTKKISILRHPVSHFRSSWMYFQSQLGKLRDAGRVTKVFPQDSTPEQEMEIFLENPAFFKKWLSFDDALYMFIINAQLGFFGYPRYGFKNQVVRLKWLYLV